MTGSVWYSNARSPVLWNFERGFWFAVGLSRTGVSAPHEQVLPFGMEPRLAPKERARTLRQAQGRLWGTLRWLCRRVRAQPPAQTGRKFVGGKLTAGAKARQFLERFAARLKSCPSRSWRGLGPSAALKRCATQNQVQLRVFATCQVASVLRALLKSCNSETFSFRLSAASGRPALAKQS